MATKTKSIFVCQNCGSERPKWEGQCRDCNAWNSLVEESVAKAPKNSRSWSVGTDGAPSQTVLALDAEIDFKETSRWNTGMSELNRVLGGGLVPGSYALLGGDPGIGKSTLLMQMAGKLGDVGRKVLYVSGEESVEQTALRAQRLGVKSAAVQVAAESRLTQILNLVDQLKPEVLIVDSIQTIYLDEIPSAPGTVSQVRECAARLMAVAKNSKVCIFLVGHITKDGSIAGPKTLEHMVDTVLSFEGDANYQFRLLRAQKNRFGPTNELGVFQMTGIGLEEVTNPSELFLAERGESLVGSTVFAAMEGTRPLLCEVQSLSSASYMPMPRRTSLGFDVNRVNLLAAVLDKHLDCDFARHDVFVNVVGGLKISEPGADVAIASAMLSSIGGQALPSQTIFFGEIGLTGEIRAATLAVERLREAEKLGFAQAVIPAGNKKHVDKELKTSKLKLHYVKHVTELSRFTGAEARAFSAEKRVRAEMPTV
jgi:DNA repair protein RadA/Sms